MGLFEMVVLLVLIGTAGKVAESYASRPKHGAGGDVQARLRAMEEELRTNEVRLAQAEEKVDELAEKLAFVEALLEKPERAAELPPPE